VVKIKNKGERMLKKLSLAALIAMGSISFSSATPLTEAIKGVNLSGMMRIRFYNEDPKNGITGRKWRTNGIFVFAVPADEHIKFVYRASVQTYTSKLNDGGIDFNTTKSGVQPISKTGVLSLNNVDTGTMNNLLFMKYSNGPLNAIVGKIPVKTPITSADPVTPGHGAGIIATYNMGNGLTLAGGYVDALKHARPTNYNSYAGYLMTNSIYTVAGIYKNESFGSAQLWYFHIPNVMKYEAVISANLNLLKDYGIDVKVNYAQSKLSSNLSSNKKKYGDIVLSGKIPDSSMSFKVGYAKAGKESGVVTTANDSPLGQVITAEQRYNIANDVDTSAIFGKLGFAIDPKTSAYVEYAGINDKTATNNDSSEIVVGGAYKYNKKLNFSVYYSMYNDKSSKNKDKNEFQFQALYKF
jgi:hypothetical protein